MRFFFCLFLLLMLSAEGNAVMPDEKLEDPFLEERARQISREIRCVVCQNETIDESHADLARDLRILIRKQLLTGKEDTEILSYIQSRYGDFVLMTPPLKPTTWFLWFAPGLFLLAGLSIFMLSIKKSRKFSRKSDGL